MSGRRATGSLEPEFVTIYFMQGSRGDRKVAVRLARLVFGLIVIGFTAVFLRVWLEMKVMQLGYQCGALKSRYARLLEEERGLLTRRNMLASLDRVEAIARTELGLQTPSREQLVFLQDPAERTSGFAGLWGSQGTWVRWLKSLRVGQPANR